jgi:hypothetical protein
VKYHKGPLLSNFKKKGGIDKSHVYGLTATHAVTKPYLTVGAIGPTLTPAQTQLKVSGQNSFAKKIEVKKQSHVSPYSKKSFFKL